MLSTWPGYLQQVKAEPGSELRQVTRAHALTAALSVEAAVENMLRSYPTRCIHIVNNGEWETHLTVHGLLLMLISIRN